MRLNNMNLTLLPGLIVVLILTGCIPQNDTKDPLTGEVISPSEDVKNKPDVEANPLLFYGLTKGYRQTVSAPEDGVELGYGWDTRTGRILPNRCIDFAPVSAGGQSYTVDFHEVSDTSEIMERLNVSASVSVKSIFGSGSASASFAKNSKVSASSNTLLMTANIKNGILFVGPRQEPDLARQAYPTTFVEAESKAQPAQYQRAKPLEARNDAVVLKPWAAHLLQTSPPRFRSYCGDSFVASLDSGALLMTSFTFKTSSKSTSSQVKAAIKADFGAVKASAEAGKSNSAAYSNSDVQINVLQVGGSGGAIPTTKDALIEKLKNLTMEAAQSPKFHTMEVASYSTLADWPSQVSLTSGDGDAEVIADYYWFLSSFYEEIDDILANPANYTMRTGLNVNELSLLQDTVLQLQKALRITMSALADNRLPLELDALTFDLDLGGPETLTFKMPDIADKVLTPRSKAVLLQDWYAELIDNMKKAVRFGSPNTLRLALPTASGSVTISDDMSEQDIQQAVVNAIIRPQVKRMCALEPTDNECLTNAELATLAALVRVN
jgi:hypothetical protein